MLINSVASPINVASPIKRNMDERSIHEQHRVHHILYHIIFCPKRRRKVLGSLTISIPPWPRRLRPVRITRPIASVLGKRNGYASGIMIFNIKVGNRGPSFLAVGTRGGRRDGRGPCACPRHHRRPLGRVFLAVGTRGGRRDGRGPCACPRHYTCPPDRIPHPAPCPYSMLRRKQPSHDRSWLLKFIMPGRSLCLTPHAKQVEVTCHLIQAHISTTSFDTRHL
jgi:hypothetical protein